jgi:hypothetical protein
MASQFAVARAEHSEALAAWRARYAKARDIKDPQQRAAALEALMGERPAHPYLAGISLAALFHGHRVLLAPLKGWRNDAKAQHAEALEAWRERRAEAQKIKDADQRAKALEALKGEKPTSPMLTAIGCVVVGAIVVAPIAHRHVGTLGTLLTWGLPLWVIVALIAGQKAGAPKTADALDQEDDDQAGEDQADQDPCEELEPAGPTPAVVHALMASAAAAGANILLTRLATELAASHPDWEPSTKAVRALLSEAGIPVRAGVRTPDGNGPGIHHQDVPPLHSPSVPAPVPAVVANVGAGQSANANANNAEIRGAGEGCIYVADPDNPARTIIIQTNAAA